jgi:hypothetical protein
MDHFVYYCSKTIIASAIFPDCWKRGTIVPIFKNKGDRSSFTNYRPVTLLNSLSKIPERVIHISLTEFITDNNLIYQYQSGFMKGHSTQRQLAYVVDMIQNSWNDKLDVRGIFLI